MAHALGHDVVFEDFFPSMVEKLGAEGFLKELSNGFRVLMDEEKEVITFESLKKNSELLGLKDNMSDDEVMCMLSEGDLDGDGCLNEMEFCVLMESNLKPLIKNGGAILPHIIKFSGLFSNC
ncbi:calcium-binding protein PBP1-like [Solanum tuberosum]|uniref:calcium-binding protein PBP1-like n=1 Tax=Solanum tuberosum TaxID=4113 RepID=UPI00073A17F4|nr:PREDICTED: calcium-binding protein PBP1-like [Solanum tuberosum]